MACSTRSDPGPAGPLTRAGGDLVLAVRVTPKASRSGVDGRKALADGRVVLAVRVTAPPEGGKANAAIERVVAEALGLPRTAVRVESGATARLKTLRITGIDAAEETAARTALGLD